MAEESSGYGHDPQPNLMTNQDPTTSVPCIPNVPVGMDILAAAASACEAALPAIKEPAITSSTSYSAAAAPVASDSPAPAEASVVSDDNMMNINQDLDVVVSDYLQKKRQNTRLLGNQPLAGHKLPPPASELGVNSIDVAYAPPTAVAAASNMPTDINLSPKKKLKRRREQEELGKSDNAKRFRPYQKDQWSEKFAELCEYREQVGHCRVPHTVDHLLPLARWVKRQRYQYKLMTDGKSCTMTEKRVKALEDIGFIWDSQAAAWEERLDELKDFKREFLHCNVPSNFADNPQLAVWVKCQRRQHKLHMDGKSSNMTPQRISALESLGFEWELRSYKKVQRAAPSPSPGAEAASNPQAPADITVAKAPVNTANSCFAPASI